jgi:uncharacterized protein (TIGR00299 family) protein
MTALAYVDPVGGAAGDMLLAAFLDAGAPLPAVQEAVDAVLPGRYRLRTEEVRRGGLRALALRVEAAGGEAPEASLRSFADLFGSLDRAPLPEAVAARARAVLRRLAEAEARVHGLGPAELPAHAAGDDDTLLDAVGVAAALESLAVERLLVGAVPLPSGGAVTGLPDHPDVPLPAPATLELLGGFRVRGLEGPDPDREAVTPTAAAVLAALGEPASGFPAMVLERVGTGAGAQDPPGRANVVRVVVGIPVPGGGQEERDLVLLEANVDDLSPELVADAAEALRAAGALDAWATPAVMKKGRPGVVVSALCEPGVAGAVREAFFRATTTFGVRALPVVRTALDRRVVAVPVAGGTVRVKLGLLGGRVVTAKPEHDDVADLAARTGRSVRELHEEASAAARTLAAAPEPRAPGALR